MKENYILKSKTAIRNKKQIFTFQTSVTKDITLHVSATNTAVCLYQKFGFKIEEVILDFYEKYLPCESRQSKHAFLLRMQGQGAAWHNIEEKFHNK